MLKLSRAKGAIYSLASIFVVGLFTIFGLNISSGVKILGKNLFDFVDYLSGNIMMPLGAIALILYVLFVWKFDNFIKEVNVGAKGLKVPAFFKPIAYILPGLDSNIYNRTWNILDYKILENIKLLLVYEY